MLSGPRRIFWRIAAALGPKRWLLGVFQRKIQTLKDELEGKLTDKFVELLLCGMDLAFILFASYRRNLRDFRAAYVLRTADQRVAASALFGNGRMTVRSNAVADPNVTITFKDPASLRRFLFSKDQDILSSILANEVEVDGNLNYVYKFGYMARDLTRRLGLQ
jgi:hypothetical protein